MEEPPELLTETIKEEEQERYGEGSRKIAYREHAMTQREDPPPAEAGVYSRVEGGRGFIEVE